MFFLTRTIKYYMFSVLFVGFLLSTQIISASAVEIKQIDNLQQEGQLAKEKNLPLLVLFSLSHCPFCKLIKEDFLIPMIISGDYKDKIIIREMNIEDNPEIIDFSGAKISSYSFAQNMDISLYPTMFFLDHQGCILAEKIRGVNTPSLFGARIDDAIDMANNNIREKKANCN